MGNEKLKMANKAKKDEFYTQLFDIENELKHYKDKFKDKIIFCNCDDPEYSEFWKYFELNFEHLGIKKLISTHFAKEKPSYKLELFWENNKLKKMQTSIKSNGDFRSDECSTILKECDIVVTNPPFSLFRDYVSQLIEYDKKFLIIGHQNAITYKEIFALIKKNKIWLGYGFHGSAAHFINKYYKDYAMAGNHKKGMIRVSGVNWYTNIEIKKRNENLIIYKKYDAKYYPKFENYDAINIDFTKNIPLDYNGIMGVPITFINKYNPKQFKIIGLGIVGSCKFTTNKKMEILKNGLPTGKFTRNAKGTLYRKYNIKTDSKKPPSFKNCDTGELYKSIYARILIQKK